MVKEKTIVIIIIIVAVLVLIFVPVTKTGHVVWGFENKDTKLNECLATTSILMKDGYACLQNCEYKNMENVIFNGYYYSCYKYSFIGNIVRKIKWKKDLNIQKKQKERWEKIVLDIG